VVALGLRAAPRTDGAGALDGSIAIADLRRAVEAAAPGSTTERVDIARVAP